MAHWTLSGVPARRPIEAATLRKIRAASAIIHRNVRCATGLSGEPAQQQLPTRQRSPTTMNNASQKSERRSQRAPDYPVQQDDKGSNGRSAPNPNGWAHVACIGQCTVTVRWCTGLSGAPIASSLPNGYGSGWGL
jgi:hypothetical protein